MDQLFQSASLGEVLTQQLARMETAAAGIETRQILDRALDETTSGLAQAYRLEPLRLRWEETTVAQAEAQVDVSGAWDRAVVDRSRPALLPGTTITYFTPFSGAVGLFHLRPSTFTANPPAGVVREATLQFSVTGVDVDADAVRTAFELNSSAVKQYVEWVNAEVDSFNEELLRKAQTAVEARRQKLTRDRQVVASLGVPIRDGEAPPPVLGYRSHQRTEPLPGRAEPTATSDPAGHLPLSSLLRRREGDELEFKSSLRWDHRLHRVNKSLEDEVLQAAAAFLNANGGEVLIGVADDGSVLGITEDLRSLGRGGEDAFLRTIVSMVVDRIGIDLAVLVDAQVEAIHSEKVGRLSVRRSPRPAFVDSSRFYVRVGSTTRQLDPKATVEYVRAHWRQ